MFKTLALATFIMASPGLSFAKDAAIGDSIAWGTGHALHVETHARQNMSSCWILSHEMTGETFDHVVISAGINDPPGNCVGSILSKVKARVIVVILPAPINSARQNVEDAVWQYGAYPISYVCNGRCTKSNFHPASYVVVANKVRAIWDKFK